MLEHLRSAGPDDASILAALHREARAAAMPWLPVVHSPEADVDYFAAQVIPNMQTAISLEGDVPVAFIATRGVWVHHLYVAPDRWGRGHGKRLLTLAQAINSALQLWTFQQNLAARAFYAHFGFQEVEFTDGSGNEERTPDVRMVWIAKD